MIAKIYGNAVSGDIHAPSSKSCIHRHLICSSLCHEETELHLTELSNDIAATCGCIRALGAGIFPKDGGLLIFPPESVNTSAVFNCVESGSTLRFMLPVAGALGCEGLFTGSGRLPLRPIDTLMETMTKNGAVFSSETLPFTLSGRLRSGKYFLPGNISSQFVSGLLMALPLLAGNSEIILTSPLQSSAYVDMTLKIMGDYSVYAEKKGSSFHIKGGQSYVSPGNIAPEGDWSSSAVLLAAGALGGTASVSGLSLQSLQPDRAILRILEKMGAYVSFSRGCACVSRRELHALELDISETPDLVSVLAVLAANAVGKSVLYNGRRLRYKETDRLITTAEMINALGGCAKALNDSLEIYGTGLSGGAVSSFDDHRIAMAAALGGLTSSGRVEISDAQVAAKSYPNFFDDLKALGLKTELYE